ncbi:hypothetical protein KQI63_07710 [bacterium]|nr:hypothetical protein [bacterium]
MKSKWIIFVVAIVALAALFWWSGQSGRAPQQQQMTTNQMGGMPDSAPHNHGLELPSITAAKVVVQDAAGETIGTADLTPNELVKLEGTDYSLKATEFYTQWNWDQHAINLSYDEANPALKVEVYKDGTLQYAGWAFKNVPFFRMTMHNQGDNAHGSTDRLAFTLMTYDGLKLPEGAGQGHEGHAHEGAEG